MILCLHKPNIFQYTSAAAVASLGKLLQCGFIIFMFSQAFPSLNQPPCFCCVGQKDKLSSGTIVEKFKQRLL